MANPHPTPKPENLTHPKWQKGQSGNPKGRPKDPALAMRKRAMSAKRAKDFTSLSGKNCEDIDAELLTYTVDQLKAVAQSAEETAYSKSLALAILTDMKAGKTTTIDKIRERLFGRPIQKMEVTGKDGADLIPARTLTKEEAQEFLADLNNDY